MIGRAPVFLVVFLSANQKQTTVILQHSKGGQDPVQAYPDALNAKRTGYFRAISQCNLN